DDTSVVTCGSCQAESTVERRQGTIALRIAAKPTKTTKSRKKLTSGLSIGQLTKQLVELREESSTVRTWKIALGTAGGIFGTVLGSMGIISSIDKDFGPGAAMLACAAGALWFVRFVMRKSAELASKIGEKIEETEIQIADRQKLDIRRLADPK